MSVIPKTLARYLVPRPTLDETWEFLRDRGERRAEGVVLWVGRVLDAETGQILGPVVPEQVAYITEDGVAVEITQEGLSALTAELPRGMFVLCRVHSHPGEAFHSRPDDDNMVISHQGAISIVVPDFGAGAPDLRRCSVHRLDHARGWQKLRRREISKTFEVTSG